MEQIKVHLAAEGSLPVVYLTAEDAADRLKERVIACNFEIIGKVWLKPDVKDEHVIGYQPIGFTTLLEKPSADSVLTLQVRDKELFSDYYIAVADETELSILGEKCNECCGTLPEIAAPTLPEPIICPAGCADADGNYTYTSLEPDNPGGLNLRLRGWFNGALPANLPDTAGYADMAAILAFAQNALTGWGAYGTWSLVAVGDKDMLQLVSDTITCAYFPIDLLPATYCLPIPEVAATINSIVIGGVTVTFPAVELSRTNPAIAVQAIAPYLIGEITEVDADDPAFPHIRYVGLQVPTDLMNDAVVVASFAAGECPA